MVAGVDGAGVHRGMLLVGESFQFQKVQSSFDHAHRIFASLPDAIVTVRFHGVQFQQAAGEHLLQVLVILVALQALEVVDRFLQRLHLAHHPIDNFKGSLSGRFGSGRLPSGVLRRRGPSGRPLLPGRCGELRRGGVLLLGGGGGGGGGGLPGTGPPLVSDGDGVDGRRPLLPAGLGQGSGVDARGLRGWGLPVGMLRLLLPGAGRRVVGGHVLNGDLPGVALHRLRLRLSVGVGGVVVVHGPGVALLGRLLRHERFLLRVQVEGGRCVLAGRRWGLRHLLLLLRVLVVVVRVAVLRLLRSARASLGDAHRLVVHRDLHRPLAQAVALESRRVPSKGLLLSQTAAVVTLKKISYIDHITCVLCERMFLNLSEATTKITEQ